MSTRERSADGLPETVRPRDVSRWVEDARRDLRSAPPERVEGAVLRRVLAEADDLPDLAPETRIERIRAARVLIQSFL